MYCTTWHIQFLKTISGDVFVCCRNYSYASGTVELVLKSIGVHLSPGSTVVYMCVLVYGVLSLWDIQLT